MKDSIVGCVVEDRLVVVVRDDNSRLRSMLYFLSKFIIRVEVVVVIEFMYIVILR